MSDNTTKKKTIRFPNNKEAFVRVLSPDENVDGIVGEFNLNPHKAVILILGDAESIDEKQSLRLTQLFSRGIARAAVEASAVIIDGGIQSAVMTMMGEGVAGRGYKTPLIGVAPLSKISYPDGGSAGESLLEPNHSHFILVEGKDWGSETATIFNLVSVLANEKTGKADVDEKSGKGTSKKDDVKYPVIVILASGGGSTKNEILSAVRQNLPIIIVEGSGGLSDEIAEAWKKRETLPDDPVMAEIIADGELHFHQLSSSVKGIERLIIRELGTNKVLMQAWETFADYDLNANLQQKKFDKIQITILIVGILGTGLAISQQIWNPNADKVKIGWWFVYYILIIIPILLTVLITAANRFKQGGRWLLLRAGAESIKREIYRYRARAQYYRENSEQELSQKVEDITRRTMRTDVNLTSLVPYNKDKGFPPYMYAAQGGDDGFSYLGPDRYIDVRLQDQLNYFKKKSLSLEGQLKRLYWGTFIIGGIGTFLAAIGLQVWIALTTAIVTALGTYLGYRQTENTLTKYNQAATDLANVKAWWNALSAEEQSLQVNIDSLVEHTEQVLQSELDGWVQQMQNALAELRKGQETPTEREEKQKPVERTKTAEDQKNAKPEDGDAAEETAQDIPIQNENKTNQPPLDNEPNEESNSETSEAVTNEVNTNTSGEKGNDDKNTDLSLEVKDDNKS